MRPGSLGRETQVELKQLQVFPRIPHPPGIKDIRWSSYRELVNAQVEVFHFLVSCVTRLVVCSECAVDKLFGNKLKVAMVISLVADYCARLI